jgi:hypothetical protein
MTDFLTRYDELDRALVRAGFPPTSPWWRDQIGRLVESGARRLVARVGRRGGKSSTLCRVAVAKALSSDWTIPPGDRAVVACVSVDRSEAGNRLRTIGEILRALRIPHEVRGDEIDLTDRAVTFKVATCSIRGVVGFTSIMLICDEMALWRYGSDDANPAETVLEQLGPTTATIPSALEFYVSSPHGVDDHHALMFDAGESADQIVCHAPSWVANPTLSEERTHQIEANLAKWSRQYAAIPGLTDASCFDSVAVKAAFQRVPKDLTSTPFLAIDASGLRGRDEWAWMVCRSDRDGALVVLHIDGARTGLQRDVIERASLDARRFGAHLAFGDSYGSTGLYDEFQRNGVTFREVSWTDTAKHEAVSWLRERFAEGRVTLPVDLTLERQLYSIRERLTPNESYHYSTGGKDRAAALLTAARAVIEGHVMLSTATPTEERSVWAELVPILHRTGWVQDPGSVTGRIEQEGSLRNAYAFRDVLAMRQLQERSDASEAQKEYEQLSEAERLKAERAERRESALERWWPGYVRKPKPGDGGGTPVPA